MTLAGWADRDWIPVWLRRALAAVRSIFVVDALNKNSSGLVNQKMERDHWGAFIIALFKRRDLKGHNALNEQSIVDVDIRARECMDFINMAPRYAIS